MRLALLGCGLLGASLAAAWRRAGAVAQVHAFDPKPGRAQRAVELGFADHSAATPQAALIGADCVALAAPVGTLATLFTLVADHAPAQALITDVGSTKAGLIAQARAALGSAFARYVPAHPIAGGALPGLKHASADLFAQHWVITTPAADTDTAALERVEAIWRSCGADVQRMDAAEHDRIFAAVSHLPHLLAFALVDDIASQPDGARKLQFAGAGFRDFTRIAASDPVMWRDIALANRDALASELVALRGKLDALQLALDAGDGAGLCQLFTRASRVRRAPAWAAMEAGRDD